MNRRTTSWMGMNWISQVKRLAIYLRDGLACCYCGATVEDGARLTLDHLKPHSKQGTNDATNLITCCHSCNVHRGNRSVKGFCAVVAKYLNHGMTTVKIYAHIQKVRNRVLPLDEAKRLILQRGSASKAITTMNKGRA